MIYEARRRKRRTKEKEEKEPKKKKEKEKEKKSKKKKKGIWRGNEGVNRDLMLVPDMLFVFPSNWAFSPSE
jgi:hypothetical protein